MAHRIGRHEKVGKALWRLLLDDLAGARRGLSARDESREEAVHRARQRLKRARSVLAVMKPALGHEARSLRRSIAAAARMLAGARDADVAAATARSLREAVTAGDDAGLDRVVATLDRKAEEAHRQDTPVEDVVARLSEIEAALKELADAVDGASLYPRAVVRTYKDGRARMKRAASSLATPDLHAWRKEVKTLWHLVRLGRRRLPKAITGMADDLKRLGDVLGFDHDHAVLAERLALSPEADHTLMRQLSMIAAERQSLEKEAFALGRHLYRRKPKAFARRARLS